MKRTRALGYLVGACMAATIAHADASGDAAKGRYAAGLSGADAVMEKAASTRTLGARATASPSATVFGGFELAQSTVVYVLVRGNSLGSLGVTNNFLDRPRLRGS